VFAGSNRRLLESIGNVPPAGFEMMYYGRRNFDQPYDIIDWDGDALYGEIFVNIL
jgi:hypothetical protein